MEMTYDPIDDAISMRCVTCGSMGKQHYEGSWPSGFKCSNESCDYPESQTQLDAEVGNNEFDEDDWIRMGISHA